MGVARRLSLGLTLVSRQFAVVRSDLPVALAEPLRLHHLLKCLHAFLERRCVQCFKAGEQRI